MAVAWERGAGDAYAYLFTEGTQYVTAAGRRLSGRVGIASAQKMVFASTFKGTRMGPLDFTFQQITPDVVVIDAAGPLLFPRKRENVPRTGLQTIVVVRQDEVWRCASFQNTQIGKVPNLRRAARRIGSRFYR